MFAIVTLCNFIHQIISNQKNLFRVKRTGRPSIDSSFFWGVYNPCFCLQRKHGKF